MNAVVMFFMPSGRFLHICHMCISWKYCTEDALLGTI